MEDDGPYASEGLNIHSFVLSQLLPAFLLCYSHAGEW